MVVGLLVQAMSHVEERQLQHHRLPLSWKRHPLVSRTERDTYVLSVEGDHLLKELHRWPIHDLVLPQYLQPCLLASVALSRAIQGAKRGAKP